jgi:hypothetical protein
MDDVDDPALYSPRQLARSFQVVLLDRYASAGIYQIGPSAGTT